MGVMVGVTASPILKRLLVNATECHRLKSVSETENVLKHVMTGQINVLQHVFRSNR